MTASIEQRPIAPFRTSSGLIVGSAYRKPPPPLTDDAERIQAALLQPRIDELDRLIDGCERSHRVVTWFSAVGLAAIVVAIWMGWL